MKKTLRGDLKLDVIKVKVVQWVKKSLLFDLYLKLYWTIQYLIKWFKVDVFSFSFVYCQKSFVLNIWEIGCFEIDGLKVRIFFFFKEVTVS